MTITRSRSGKVALILLALIFVGSSAVVWGQESKASGRGFQPAGSYALSDLETINTVNGNMILNFPLGKLAPGRGGLSAGINVVYNSKLYDTRLEYVPDDSNQITAQNFLKTSDSGGWRYGFTYAPRLINRLTDLDNPPQCPDAAAIYIWKLQMIFPDGNSREFRPTGFIDNYGDGYYTIRPDGWQTSCPGGTQPSVTTGMTYYSTDGTYLRLFFPHTTNNDWTANWTLSMPDGSRVVVDQGLQRVYDRNGNYTEFSSITNYNNTNHPATVISDQLGRTVALESDVATQQDYIYSIGVNGEQLKTTVKWKTIYVNRGYRTTSASNGIGRIGNSWQSLDNLPLKVIDRITLPAQAGSLAYVFGYNGNDTATAAQSIGYGELTSILMPSQTQSSYHFALDSSTPPTSGQFPNINFVLDNHPSSKTLTYQAEYDGTVTPVTETWQYSINETTSSVTAPDGGVTTETHGTTATQNAETGLNYKTQRPDGTVVEHLWQQNLPVQVGTGVGLNPFIKTEFTSIKDAAGNLTLTGIKDYNYDKNGNVTQVREYDWVAYSSITRDAAGRPTGIPSGLTPTRVTTNTYYNPTPDASDSTTNSIYTYIQSTAPQFRKALASAQLGSGAGQTLSRTEFDYDNRSTKGNLIEQKSWDSTKGGYSNPLTTSNSVSVYTQYNQYGSPILTTDAKGFQTQLVYGAVGGITDLYPTEVRSAYQTAVQRTETRQYDFSTGVVTTVTDADNAVSTSTTYDVFGRPILIQSAVGTPEETRTSMDYSDTARRVITRSDLSALGDGKLVSIQHYDQLGRVRLARQLEDVATQSATDETTGIKVQTRYTFSGSSNYQLTSNPYRASLSSSAGPETTMGWTRSKSDNGGRLVEVQTFGGPVLPAPWGTNSTPTGTVTTVYNAEFTTVTDQSLKVRRSRVDGLGRLVRVDEPDADSGSLDANGNPVQSTSYEYDALGNLRHVTQGLQNRFFMYDSLSRLIRASNPEQQDRSSLAITDPVTSHSQWSTKYEYDEGGNLRHKTDARGIVSDYDYDALDRNTSVVTNDANTPTITRIYDTAPLGKGRLRSTQTSGASGSLTVIDDYDAMGRAKGSTQTLGSQTYTVSYTYDLASHVKTIDYPSGHRVTNTYDGAGRIYNFSGKLGDNAQRDYATGITYAPTGGLSQEQLGTATPVYNKLFYNSRGQLAEIREGLTPNNDSFQRGAIINFNSTCWGMCYLNGVSQSMPDNNGNLKTQEYWIQDGNGNVIGIPAQQYEYDQLSRLKRVYEGSPTQPTWQQRYAYDRYGNRRIDLASGLSNPTNLAAVVSNTITNRMYAPGETEQNHPLIDYDLAGNQTKDYYSESATGVSYDRIYDAENRMTRSTANFSSPASTKVSTYTYDGNGQRVRRNIDNVETWQIYGLGGELLAEYAKDADHLIPQKEYGYRNGQLLITATAATSWGSPPILHDNPLVVAETTVQARHITELRDAINALRTHLGLPVFSWQQPPTINVGDWIKADPIIEMRTALDQALGAPSPAYSAGLAQGLPIKAIHIQELRDRVLTAWNTGGTDIRWLVSDQLGTPRMTLDQSGNVGETRHDYLPFGEDLSAGGRGTNLGYGTADNARQKFTQKERDSETNLDYFLARYYSSLQGRFTSPDEFTGGPDEYYEFHDLASQNPTFYADLTDPQSLNKYQYGYNNPLLYIDPDGHQGIKEAARAAFSTFTGNIKDMYVGEAKAVANIGIAIMNTNVPEGERIDYFEPSNNRQDRNMRATIIGLVGFTGMAGKPAPPNIMFAESKPAVAASEAASATRGSKLGGSITEPNPAPTGTIVREEGVNIVRRTSDHAPAHLHVSGRGPNTRIGQNGNPLRNNPALSARQRQVVQTNLRVVRQVLRQVMREHRYNRQ